ncbi:nitrogenase component 1, partial [Methanomethylovorans sp.]
MTERNYTTVNPCVMCQPMGSVMAFKGIESSMVLMHGSQGCSTYMRLHLSHHFREPVDIASTSLSERGAVYGGSENLKKGLRNVITRYHPKVIGVTTTCLAETIGDDVGRILTEFREEDKNADDVHIISVSTPSYEDSHTTGFIKAVDAIVRHFTEYGMGNDIFNNKLNVVLGEHIAPEDTRELKRILTAIIGLRSFIFLPDASETFDAPMTGKVEKIFPGGTPLSDIIYMKNCAASIGLGITSDNRAVDHLETKYNVPA